MSLKEQLAEYRAGWYKRVPPERQAIMERHIAQLRTGAIQHTMLKVGDKAPTFQGTDEQGNALKSADHVGKKTVVIFFFPAAFTGG